MNVTRRLSIAIAAAVAAAPALASCGFGVQTDQVYNPGVGTNNRTGKVDVLDALVVSGTRGQGTVVAGLSNNNEIRPDKLVSVSGAGKNQGLSVQQGERPTIEPGGFVQLADLTDGVFVRGGDVVPGRLVTLRFTFKNAESITLDAPVVARTSEYANVPAEAPSPSTPTSRGASSTESPAPSPTS